MSATAHLSMPGSGRLAPLPRSRVARRASAAPTLAAFALLCGYGVFRWATLLQDASAARLLGLVGLACGVAALGGPARASDARVRLAAAAGAVLLSLAMLPVSGIPLSWVLELRLTLVAQAINHGVTALPGVLVPYRGGDPWTRAVIVLGAGMLMLGGALTLASSRRPLGVTRLTGAALPLVVLATVPSALAEPLFAWLHGLVLLVLLAVFVLSETIAAERLAAATAFLGVAAAGALALTPALSGHHPWIRFTTLASRLGTGAETFNWAQTYGPLAWPQDGVTALEVRAARGSYWKAENLDSFNGTAWVQASAPLTDPLLSIAPANLRRWTQKVTVRLADISTRQLITAGMALSTTAGSVVTPGQSPGTFVASRPLASGFEYDTLAYTPRPTAAQEARAGTAYPLPALAPDLEVAVPPRAGGAPRVLQFASYGAGASFTPSAGASAAQQATALAGSPYARAYALALKLRAGTATPYAFVAAVQRYLGNGYGYDQSPPAARYPLLSFLFGARRGYCQQFAGSMALLLRMGGVPARVADGFTTGSYDPAGHGYAVSDLDAHAWVEVWFPSYGWVTFDPTPAIDPALAGLGLDSGAGTAFPAGLELGPKQTAQPGGAATVGRRPRRQPSGDGTGTLIAGAAVALALLALLSVAVVLRRGRPAGAEERLAELERALERCGRALDGGVTLAAVERSFADAPQAAEYVSRIRRARFAGGAPMPTAAQRRALRRRLGQGRGPIGRLRALLALPPARRGRPEAADPGPAPAGFGR